MHRLRRAKAQRPLNHDYPARQPTGRYVAMEGVGAMAVLLCSPLRQDITGASLPMDGGWSISGHLRPFIRRRCASDDQRYSSKSISFLKQLVASQTGSCNEGHREISAVAATVADTARRRSRMSEPANHHRIMPFWPVVPAT